MSENGLISSTILDCSVALNDVEDNMMDSVKVGLKYGELCYTLGDSCNMIATSSSSSALSCLSLKLALKSENTRSAAAEEGWTREQAC